MKDRLFKALEQNYDTIVQIGDNLFEHPEVGFFEKETERIICEYLDELGVSYQNHICRHGVMCTLGEGDYHIAVLADMDALLTQMDGEVVPFHSCGHSIQVTVLLNLISGLVKSGLLHELDGKITFLFTPAEEYIDLDTRKQLKEEGQITYYSGKQNLIAEGLFDSFDVVLSCHIMGKDPKHPEAKFDINSTLAGFLHKDIEYYGMASHAGVIPHLGRNALHAATLSLNAIQMLKDTFSPEAGSRVFPILTEGGTTANTICDYAKLETYLRIIDEQELLKINAQITNACEHCALALETRCVVTDTNGYLPLRQNKELTEVVHQNMLMHCEDSDIIKNVISGASGDIGDVSFLLPTIQFGFSGIEGNVHSSEFTIVDKKHCYEMTAKVLGGTILDLLTKKQLQVKKERYEEKKEFYMTKWLQA